MNKDFTQVSLPMDDLSENAIAVLDGYWVVNTVPEALAIAIDEFVNSDNPFIIDDKEISPLEMLDIIHEILSVYNKEVAK